MAPGPSLPETPGVHITPSGRQAARVAGEGPPVLLVHGIPTSGWLWRHVVADLALRYCCIAPDLLGLGDSLPHAGVGLSMDRQACALLELMDTLGHDAFALVAHDQGGAAAQQLLLQAPGRVTAAVFTNCVCFDNWPVPTVRRLQRFVRAPGADWVLRSGLMTRLQADTPLSAFKRGVFDRDGLSGETIRRYLAPLTASPERRRAFVDFLLAGSPAPTLEAAPALARWPGPALVIWAENDRYIPVHWGDRLAETLPGSGPLVRREAR